MTGTEQLTYTASDGLQTSTARVTVSILPPSALVADDASVRVAPGQNVLVALPVVDGAPGPLTPPVIEIVDAPAIGTANPQTGAKVRIFVPSGTPLGPYTFTYRADDGAQQTPPATVTVTVVASNTAPTADDLAVTTPAGIPVDITLAGDDPDGAAVTYQIVSFPAAGSTTGTAPHLRYNPGAAAPGVYTLTYRASDGSALSGVATVTITVTAAPDEPVVDLGPDRTVDEGTASFPSAAKSPTGSPLTYAWDFGDGRTSTQPSPGVVFDDGTHTVTLTVTDATGRTATDSVVLDVRNRPPTMSLTPSAPFLAGLPSRFSVLSHDPGPDALGFVWDFGDGGSSTSSGPSVEHTFDTAGTYLVTLVVTDDDGASASQAVEVVVVEPVVDAGPDQHVPEGSLVTFTGDGYVAGAGAGARYDWNFGDGSSVASGTTVQHRFSGDVPRTVTLTIGTGPTAISDTVSVTFENQGPTLAPAVPLVVEAGSAAASRRRCRRPGRRPVHGRMGLRRRFDRDRLLRGAHLGHAR